MRFKSGMTSALMVMAAATAADAQRTSNITISRGEFAVTPFYGYLLSQRFVDGPVGTSLNVASAPLYGVQASLPLAPSASIIGTVGYASGDLEAGLPIVGGIYLGETTTTVFDASVELRLDNGGRFIPLVQFGGGATRREVTVLGISSSTTDFEVSGGIGADFPFSSSIALRLMAKDYYGKADFGSIGDFEASTDDLHAVAFTGGLRIAF
jgi:opacity protein-like surface antigen